MVWDYLELWCGSYWLLNHFLNEIEIKLKLESILMLLKNLWWVRYKESISQFSELRCGRYWFLDGFCCWKFKQIAKIGFKIKENGVANALTFATLFFFFQSCNFELWHWTHWVCKKELWPTWRHLFPKQTFKFQPLETWTFFASTIYQHLFGRKVSLEVKS